MQTFQNKIRFILKKDQSMNNISINKLKNTQTPLYNFFEDSENSSEEQSEEHDDKIEESEEKEQEKIEESEEREQEKIEEIEQEKIEENIDDWELISIE